MKYLLLALSAGLFAQASNSFANEDHDCQARSITSCECNPYALFLVVLDGETLQNKYERYLGSYSSARECEAASINKPVCRIN